MSECADGESADGSGISDLAGAVGRGTSIDVDSLVDMGGKKAVRSGQARQWTNGRRHGHPLMCSREPVVGPVVSQRCRCLAISFVVVTAMTENGRQRRQTATATTTINNSDNGDGPPAEETTQWSVIQGRCFLCRRPGRGRGAGVAVAVAVAAVVWILDSGFWVVSSAVVTNGLRVGIAFYLALAGVGGGGGVVVVRCSFSFVRFRPSFSFVRSIVRKTKMKFVRNNDDVHSAGISTILNLKPD